MVEDERRVAGWQSWTTVRALAANRRGLKENVTTTFILLSIFSLSETIRFKKPDTDYYSGMRNVHFRFPIAGQKRP